MCPGVTARRLLSKCSHKSSSLILFCVRSAARARFSASKSCDEKRVLSSSRPSFGSAPGWPLEPDVRSFITGGAACRTGLGPAGSLCPEGGTPACRGLVYAAPVWAGRPPWLIYNHHNPTVNMRGFNGLSEEVVLGRRAACLRSTMGPYVQTKH